ncbi:MAG: 7-cyano-7-deazaguanine synthase QueC [Planctomycetes bacterium RBG_16_43_13]|nr:MAG: 7-cyano-7-deazaguanine synthase QueC [Planctomycetes bacterium RBG_16_43_13]
MKAIALLSGGLDSTVALAKAREKHKIVLALNFDYGQRAARREDSAARRVANHYKIPYKNIKLEWLEAITDTALVKESRSLPLLKMSQLDNKKITTKTARAVWVPNRNGVFINIAAGFAEAVGARLIVTGFNREEAETFPDNSQGFMDAINKSLAFSTLNSVKVTSPTGKMDKVAIVKLGMKINAPLEFVWSCYEGGRTQGGQSAGSCKRCESCQRFMRACEKSKINPVPSPLFLKK